MMLLKNLKRIEISLFYQMDSNNQLRAQSANDDILLEIKEFASELTTQNDRIIELLEGIKNASTKNV